ncbi:PadR family transcriptional regulator [Dermacoccaceae bacterium W4C1]
MALEHAILVSLAEQPATGYDLTRRFGKSMGYFWPATHQQIYRTLARMEEQGMVTAVVHPGQGRPDRKVYELTDAGREEFLDYTRRPTPPFKTKMELAVKVRGMMHGDRAAVLDDVRAQRDGHVKQLDEYQRYADQYYPDPSRIPDDQLPVYLVLRGGIRSEQGFIDWCDEMLAALDPSGSNDVRQ